MELDTACEPMGKAISPMTFLLAGPMAPSCFKKGLWPLAIAHICSY